MFACDLRGVPQDLEAAFRYFKEASYQDPFSASMAGEMLMRGAGVEPDYQKAFEVFEKTEVRVACGAR